MSLFLVPELKGFSSIFGEKVESKCESRPIDGLVHFTEQFLLIDVIFDCSYLLLMELLNQDLM